MSRSASCVSRLAALCFMTCGLLMPFYAHAGLGDSEYTDTEKVGYAFAKLGNIKPDYDTWIKTMPLYLAATPVDKLEVLKQQRARLQEGFYNYNPDEDLIHVQADVSVRRDSGNTDSLTQGRTAGDQPKRLVLVSFVKGDSSFPFHSGNLWIAVIPQNVENYETISIPASEYHDFLKKIGFGGPYNIVIPAVIDMRLRPVTADAKNPEMVGQTPYWPMLAQIVSVSLWDKTKTRVAWTYGDEDSDDKEKRKLMDLFDK